VLPKKVAKEKGGLRREGRLCIASYRGGAHDAKEVEHERTILKKTWEEEGPKKGKIRRMASKGKQQQKGERDARNQDGGKGLTGKRKLQRDPR